MDGEANTNNKGVAFEIRVKKRCNFCKTLKEKITSRKKRSVNTKAMALPATILNLRLKREVPSNDTEYITLPREAVIELIESTGV